MKDEVISLLNKDEKVKSDVLTHLFKEWVDGEFDIELLMMTAGLINARKAELDRILSVVYRNEITGFKNL